MKVSLRVLAALSEKRPPDAEDVQTLRNYIGDGPPDLDELACAVIQKALGARARARGTAR